MLFSQPAHFCRLKIYMLRRVIEALAPSSGGHHVSDLPHQRVGAGLLSEEEIAGELHVWSLRVLFSASPSVGVPHNVVGVFALLHNEDAGGDFVQLHFFFLAGRL